MKCVTVNKPNDWQDIERFLGGEPCGNRDNFDPEAIPKTGEGESSFMLYRGVTDASYLLQSKLERVAKKRFAGAWRDKIGGFECKLVEDFLGLFGYTGDPSEQAAWPFIKKRVTDAFFLLSVMQHYGLPTRLLDFTSSLPMALFFATDRWKGGSAAVYQLRCKNEFRGDEIPCSEIGRPESPNKLPRDEDGKPWRVNGGDVNVSDLLGRLIQYRQFGSKQPGPVVDGWSKLWGWDAPHVRNARIAMQQGFFVYNVDVKRSIQDDLNDALKKDPGLIVTYEIKENMVPQIWAQLARLGIVRWRVYWDVESQFRDLLERTIMAPKP